MRMATTLPADPTLDEIRAALAPLIAENAAFDGFSGEALADAAGRLGVDADIARLAFPGGARDMVDAWFASIDAAMAERWPAEKLATLKRPCPPDGGEIGLLECALPRSVCVLTLFASLSCGNQVMEQNQIPVYVGEKGMLEAAF